MTTEKQPGNDAEAVRVMDRHTPIRMCVICRRRAPKTALTRFTAGPEGTDPVPDKKRGTPGRGMYLCDEPRCRAAFSRRCAKRKAKGQKL
jgi:predicted RNA-binding protein YlxR (DUF448 family)